MGPRPLLAHRPAELRMVQDGGAHQGRARLPAARRAARGALGGVPRPGAQVVVEVRRLDHHLPARRLAALLLLPVGRHAQGRLRALGGRRLRVGLIGAIYIVLAPIVEYAPYIKAALTCNKYSE